MTGTPSLTCRKADSSTSLHYRVSLYVDRDQRSWGTDHNTVMETHCPTTPHGGRSRGSGKEIIKWEGKSGQRQTSMGCNGQDCLVYELGFALIKGRERKPEAGCQGRRGLV